VALNTFLNAPRVSFDIDLFHDTEEALQATWANDRALLSSQGYEIQVLREARAYVEVIAARGTERVILQWVRDSAFRFFPLLEDELFGLVLHPFDLATNKVLALAGRLEVRDWVDVLECHDRMQPLGYIVWAACGKDPGFSPDSLLVEARRSGRYSQPEVDELAFEGQPPDARALGLRWHTMLDDAARIISMLPAPECGKAVLTASGELYRKEVSSLSNDLSLGEIRFHQGRIRGVWPTVKPVS